MADPTEIKPVKNPFDEAASELRSQVLKEDKSKLAEQLKKTLKAGEVYNAEKKELSRLNNELAVKRLDLASLVDEIKVQPE